MIAACSRDGTGCGGAEQTSSVQAGGSKAAAIAVPPEYQDAFERAWLDAEFVALDQDLEGHESTVSPLDFGDCAGVSAKHCLGKRIGHRYDSAWTRAEVRDTAVLLLVFHARADPDEDTESGNELVVFRGRLVSDKGGPLKLEVVSRNAARVSDAVGAALGRRAVTPDVKDGNILWGIRFEPLSPKAFSLVDSLPGEWVQQVEGPNGDEVFVGVAGNRGRWFILKEPKLRMAWLSWSERDGRFEPLRDVTKRWGTYHLGAHRLRWDSEARSVGSLSLGGRDGEGEPYLPARDEVGLMSTDSRLPSPEESPKEPWTDEELSWPQAVRRHLVHCTSRSAQELKPGLYEARCGCGNPCGYSTFVDVKGGRTSSAFWLPLGVDARRERVVVSTEASMPIRIVGMFDEREWKVIRRPAGDAMELSHIVEATFTGDRLHLRYSDRRWEKVEEVVALPRQVPRPRPEDSRVFVQDLMAGGADLHTHPELDAEVVTRVSAGTGCRLLDDLPGPWVQLECEGLSGFMVGSLVGPDRPRLDAPSEPAPSTKDGSGGVSLDAWFEQLAKDRRSGGLHERIFVTRELDATLHRKETMEEALRRELEKIEFDWHRLQVRGDEFVSAMYRGGALVMYAGHFEPMRIRNRGGPDREVEETFLVHIERRARMEAPEALVLALQQGARPAPLDGPRYSALEQESAGMPELSREAFLLYQSLPKRWHTLHTRPGSRFVTSRCEFVTGAELRVDVHRRASLRFGDLGPKPTRVSQALRVTDIAKTASGYRFKVRAAPDDTRKLTLTWPTAEVNVSRWKSEPPAPTDGDYATEVASNIDLDVLGCGPE